MQLAQMMRSRRWQQLGQYGATVWLTGLSGAGKTTVAEAIEEQLTREGRWTYCLDGDELRRGLSSDLGFSSEDRSENVRRAAEVALLLADAGAVAIVALMSPSALDRARARTQHENAGLDFIEVYVNTSLDECERRDPKGLYARARRGEIAGVVGIDIAYEPPQAPEVELQAGFDVEHARASVLAAIPKAASAANDL
jgi:bifunctional enzyme CysN/CysC